MPLPIHTPETFGQPEPEHAARQENLASPLSFLQLAGENSLAPDPKEGEKPSVKRVLSTDNANLILATFTPGQMLKEHKAAHPITVQCLQGKLLFGCGGETYTLTPGSIVHLPAYVVHWVECPDEADQDFSNLEASSKEASNKSSDSNSSASTPSVMLLTMLTGKI